MTMTAEQLAQLRVLTERAISDGWGYDRDEFYEVLTPEMTLALLNDLGAKDITLSARDYHFDQQADRIEYLEKRIAELEAISSAAEKLVRCKGRYHSETIAPWLRCLASLRLTCLRWNRKRGRSL